MGSNNRRKRKYGKGGMIIITVAAVVLFAVLFIQGISLRKTVAANELRKQELIDSISEEEQRTEDIEAMRDYLDSEENIKETARDKLGLVEDDEIIFKSE